jgi:hypothetical protein
VSAETARPEDFERDENGYIAGTPPDECGSIELSDESCRAIARVFDEIRAARARREAGGAA